MAKSAKVVTVAKSSLFVPTATNITFARVIVKSLDELSKERKAWEATAYKKSTDGLYSLLGKGLDLFNARFMQGTNDDRKTLRLELIARLTADNIRVQRNSTTLTLFIRFVFGSDRKRAHGYQYVLKAAISHGIGASGLADWLSQQGGIEEVRRKTIVSEEALKNIADREVSLNKVKASAERAVHNPLATVKLAPHGKLGEFSVMVGMPDDQGVVSIIAVLHNANAKVIGSLMNHISKERLADENENAAIAAEMKGLKPSKTVAIGSQKLKLAA